MEVRRRIPVGLKWMEEEVDFIKEVTGWKYKEKGLSVRFQERDDESGTSGRSKPSRRLEKQMDSEGVFFLRRMQESKQVFAVTIPVSHYQDPEVQAAMTEEMA